MNWEYRIIKTHEEYKHPNDKLSIQECLMDTGGIMVSHTIDYIIDGKDIDEIKTKLKEMKSSLKKPILVEIRGIDYDNSD
mgnify:CR=1 FL=1|jgi:hypothetical protein